MLILAFTSLDDVVLAKDFQVRVMTYNTENFFDTTHDPGKNDWTYLPLSLKKSYAHKKRCRSVSRHHRKKCLNLDWNEKALSRKATMIAHTINSSFGQRGPEILVLTEIENKVTLDKLKGRLNGTYESAILIEDSDPRGIDIAIISKFPQILPAKIHKIPGLKRGILEATFKLPNSKSIRVFGVHFPAPYHPRSKRVKALHILEGLAKGSLTKHDAVIAAGDFNIASREGGSLFRGIAAKFWQVSHLVGCHQCPGTYFYKKSQTWSFLDAILLASTQCQLMPRTIEVIRDVSKASDHLPLIGNLSCKTNRTSSSQK